MKKGHFRQRWLFPLALERVALEGGEYLIHQQARRFPREALGSVLRARSEARAESEPDARAQWPWPVRLRTALLRFRYRRLSERLHRLAVLRSHVLLRRMLPLPDSLRFDRSFLEGAGARAVAARDPAALARAWAGQFTYGADEEPRRADDLELLTSLAELYLGLLEEQLRSLRRCSAKRAAQPLGAAEGS